MCIQWKRHLLTIALSATVLISTCYASNFNEPHVHNGKVSPFKPGDPNVPLDANAIKILKSGKPYQTQIQTGTAGRGLVVQDINAPVDIVWGRILDYDNYSKMVPKTLASNNYKVIDNKPTKNDPHTQTIYTRMTVGFPILKLEFFIKHLYYPNLNSLTWTLDYEKKSDFDDSCGYWYIIPHPENPNDCTRVFYSVEVSLFDWIPKFAVDFMSSKALTDATAWVKKYSELEYEDKEASSSAVVEPSSNEKVKTKPKKGIFKFFKNKKVGEKAKDDEKLKIQREEEEKRRIEEEREEESKKMVKTWVRATVLAVITMVTYNAMVTHNAPTFFL
mmetsp:Transcript_9824/g.13898  ORF Transcript_9824/g.13898 Transcript_9824/m.13898 type:complete len:332 (-) Transcript_9824:58-1053(-)